MLMEMKLKMVKFAIGKHYHKKEADLEAFYSKMLRTLGTEKGMLGQIFTKSQNKIQDPAKLLKVITMMIDKENWSLMGADVKGKIYEGLLLIALHLLALVDFFDTKPN